MTRDEASEKANAALKCGWCSDGERFVAMAEAIGILKLDDPKSEQNHRIGTCGNFVELVTGYGMKLDERDAENIWRLIHAHGLRIVAK